MLKSVINQNADITSTALQSLQVHIKNSNYEGMVWLIEQYANDPKFINHSFVADNKHYASLLFWAIEHKNMAVLHALLLTEVVEVDKRNSNVFKKTPLMQACKFHGEEGAEILRTLLLKPAVYHSIGLEDAHGQNAQLIAKRHSNEMIFLNSLPKALELFLNPQSIHNQFGDNQSQSLNKCINAYYSKYFLTANAQYSLDLIKKDLCTENPEWSEEIILFFNTALPKTYSFFSDDKTIIVGDLLLCLWAACHDIQEKIYTSSLSPMDEIEARKRALAQAVFDVIHAYDDNKIGSKQLACTKGIFEFLTQSQILYHPFSAEISAGSIDDEQVLTALNEAYESYLNSLPHSERIEYIAFIDSIDLDNVENRVLTQIEHAVAYIKTYVRKINAAFMLNKKVMDALLISNFISLNLQNIMNNSKNNEANKHTLLKDAEAQALLSRFAEEIPLYKKFTEQELQSFAYWIHYVTFEMLDKTYKGKCIFEILLMHQPKGEDRKWLLQQVVKKYLLVEGVEHIKRLLRFTFTSRGETEKNNMLEYLFSEYIMRKGDINWQDPQVSNNTFLMNAMLYNVNESIINRLLAENASLVVQDLYGYNIFDMALKQGAFSRKEKFLTLLLDCAAQRKTITSHLNNLFRVIIKEYKSYNMAQWQSFMDLLGRYHFNMNDNCGSLGKSFLEWTIDRTMDSEYLKLLLSKDSNIIKPTVDNLNFCLAKVFVNSADLQYKLLITPLLLQHMHDFNFRHVSLDTQKTLPAPGISLLTLCVQTKSLRLLELLLSKIFTKPTEPNAMAVEVANNEISSVLRGNITEALQEAHHLKLQPMIDAFAKRGFILLTSNPKKSMLVDFTRKRNLDKDEMKSSKRIKPSSY